MKVYIIEQTVFGGWSHISTIVAVKSTEEKAIEAINEFKSKDSKSCYNYKEYEVE